MKLNLILVFSICCVFIINAQQDPQYTQYMYNTMSVNPAYAGSRGHGVITAIGRTQWVGFDGAPETQNLSYDTPLGYSGLGLGVNLVNDKIGPSHEIYLDANVSYTVETSDLGNLAFGLRLGGRWLNIDWTKGKVQDAETFPPVNRFLPTIGAGIYFHKPEWYIGLSVPNILRKEHYDADTTVGEVAVERMHFFLIAGYVFDINEDLKFKPAALLKGVSGAPLSLDVSANLLFNEKFRVGLGWRWGDSISGLLGFQVSDSMLIGYSYDLTTSNYNVVNSGTHEIMLRYELLREIRYRSPRFF
ncbi:MULTISPECIES: type IX secretion system membrane protein PorP/SprF [unclassified Tenacibaculum]|uniref:PorP/SprF family type IX secretion system membrane protein n=1 Tax=unclassified Tenacibaculum TaxID=2635139 RepID=UPI001F1F44A0|nr:MULTISPECIES: type IX secretion system membrane protein PorP/SprF [unclassified Tenacibaculum]MCF2874438.1 type IX secretion system membrane protein PorP/SprF [Tenacibaculum sp. Cn5-1]MCF2935019.1 type IX secretion system membrane protein PorP/SprF [Tenacibaculum sp. Cn5-34]MCG7511229.1 type IX secretion system membrane protein PorP/SprF [Tenacibaculum sp. Cn5-46]